MPVVKGIYFVRAAVKLLTTPAGPGVYRGTPEAQLIPYSTLSCHSDWKNWNNTFWDFLGIVANLPDIGNECLWTLCGCSFKLKPLPYSTETHLHFWSACHICHFMGFHARNVFLWLHSMSWKKCVWLVGCGGNGGKGKKRLKQCKGKYLKKLKIFKIIKLIQIECGTVWL